MKWMGWGPEQLAMADPEIVHEIIRQINEEAERLAAIHG